MKEIEKYLIENYNKAKINSKDISKGDVFLALSGKKTHGNDFINEAFDNGAKYVITDMFSDVISSNQNIVVVENIHDYLLDIAKIKRKLFKGKIIGVTGSVGKTSVKENLKYFLSHLSKVSASIKSYNNLLGIVVSLINLDLLSDYLIVEMGTNNFSEIKELTSIVMPSQIIITNILPTHLEKLINTRNIAIEKADIYNPQYNSKAELVILPNSNIDEQLLVKIAKKNKIKNIQTFGDNSKLSYNIEKIHKIDEIYVKLYLSYEGKIIYLIINNNQLYRLNNILICFIIFSYNKLDINLFLSLAKNIPLLSGRGKHNEIFFYNKKINFIDESYNASPETMKNCINYFIDLKIKKNQKKILILGDMKELGKQELLFHIDLLDYISQKKLKNVIICGELMQLALNKLDNNKILFMQNINLISEFLKKILNDNDIILIKGSNSSITNKLAEKFLQKGDF
jgi:UDP-N-acetylmuramoyl-tripeptide--D-alanyl-D-alanine ligase